MSPRLTGSDSVAARSRRKQRQDAEQWPLWTGSMLKKRESWGITRSLSISLVAQSSDFEPPDPFRLMCFMLASISYVVLCS